MKTSLIRLTSVLLFQIWFILAAFIFMQTNRNSYIHLFSFNEWEDFAKKIPEINYLSAALNIAYSAIGIIVFYLICMGIGLIILNYLKIPETGNLIKGITAFAIGEIFFSILFLSIISINTLTPSTTSLILIVMGIISASPVYFFFTSYIPKLQNYKLTFEQKVLAGAITGVILSSLLLTSARLGYDAVSDYFSQAKLMAAIQETSSFFPENYMIVSSLHPDILFTILIQTFGDQSARMLSWVNGLAILFIGYAIAEKNGLSMNARLYFMVLLITTTAFTDLLGDGKVELICTTPILVAIYWMSTSIKMPSKNVFLLIGFLAGFSIISRLYNIFIVSVFVAIFYLIALKSTLCSKKGKVLIGGIIWALPSLLLIAVFHLWQNWVWLGSPLAPLDFADKLESSNWEWKFDPALLNTLRLLYPFTVSFLNSPQSLGSITPLFIGFLPFWAIKDVRLKCNISNSLWQILITAIITLAIWVCFFYTVVEIRYVMFIWVLLFLPLGELINHTLEYQSGLSFISRFLIGLLLTFITIRIIIISVSTYSPIRTDGEAYCSGVTLCDFFEPLYELANPGDRVFALNAYRYYFRNDLFYCSTRANEYPEIKILANKNPSEFWVELYRNGYRFIAFEENFSVNHSRFGLIPDTKFAPSWLKVSVVSSSGKNILYQLEANNPPIQSEISCQKNSLGIWQIIDLSKSQ